MMADEGTEQSGGGTRRLLGTGPQGKWLGWLLLGGLLTFLLYRQCGITSTQLTLGPYRVAVAMTPDPPQIGPAVMHLQVSTEAGRPTMEASPTAQLVVDGGRRAPAQITPKAVDGAYEIHFAVPATGRVDVELQLKSATWSGGTTFRVDAGRSEVEVVSGPAQ